MIALSFETLFRLHSRLRYPRLYVPVDDGHYDATWGGIAKWNEYTQARYTLEVKNAHIYEMLLPLSRCYPDLCFVNSELCLDDCSITCTYTRRRRQSHWEYPQSQIDAHWTAAAKRHRVRNMERAYENDEIRSEAEFAMLEEALQHWNGRVRKVLGRALPAMRVSG